MTSLAPQQVDGRALIWRLVAPFRPVFVNPQQAGHHARIDALDREHAAAQAQQHHDSSS